MSQWSLFWARAQVYFRDYTLDVKCKDPSHIYFLPAAPSAEGKKWMEDVTYHYENIDGEPLDVGMIKAHQLPKVEHVSIVPADFAGAATLSLESLKEILSALSKKLTKTVKTAPNGKALGLLLEGLPYSEEGGRHAMCFELVKIIAKTFPKESASNLVLLFENSQEAMRCTHESAPDTVEAVERMLATELQKNSQYIDERKNEEAIRQRYFIARSLGVKEDTLEIPNIDDPTSFAYTEEQIKQIAENTHITTEELSRCWIMMGPRAKEVYINTLAGIVPVANNPDNLATQRMLLLPSPLSPLLRERHVSLFEMSYDDTPIKKLARHGIALSEISYDNTIERDCLDYEHCILKKSCPKNHFDAVFHQEVDDWLDLLFAERQDNKGREWLSLFPQTSESLCALYLAGPPATGKSLLSSALANIWRHGKSVRLKDAMNQFNAEMLHTPFLLAEEGEMGKADTASSQYRELVSGYTFTIEPKFKEVTKSVGYRRVMINSNNDNAVSFNNASNLEWGDLEALQRRTLLIHVDRLAGEYLENIFQNTNRKDWVSRNIPEHVTWLSQNVDVPITGSRFRVEGDIGTIGSNMLLANDEVQIIFSIIKKQMDDWSKDPKGKPSQTQYEATGLWFGDGDLCFVDKCIRSRLDDLIAPNEKKNWRRASRHYCKVTEQGRGRVTKRLPNGMRINVYRVDLNLFYNFLKEGSSVEFYKKMIDDE